MENWLILPALIIWFLMILTNAHQQDNPYGSNPQQHVHNPNQQQQQQHAFQGQAGQHGHHGQKQGNVLDKDHVQDREHIKEHLEGVISQTDTSKMTEQELQFHYFKMHDSDNNNKLDGCELIKSLIHWHEHAKFDPDGKPVYPKIFTDAELVEAIEPLMLKEDLNSDGFIDYPEFVAGHTQRGEAVRRN